MALLIVSFVIIAIVCVILQLQKINIATSKKSKKINVTQQEFSYRLHEALFTKAEILFYQELNKAVDEKFTIFGKVRVADIITPEKGLSKSNWQKAFNKISAKHFDFVLCNKYTLKVEAVIELDDKSHRQSNRIKRDKFLNQAAQTAGLKILHFPVTSSYSTKEIQAEILRILE